MSTSPFAPAYPEGTACADIAGVQVPVRFSDPTAEYQAVRERAALFDLTGASVIEIGGPGATDFAQRVLARDVEYLTSETTMSSLVLADDGSVVDQVVVWGREDGMYLESSIGRGAELLAHLQERAADADAVTVTDRTDEFGLFALEGPYAWGVVGRVIDAELAAMPFESIVDTRWDGVDIVFARAGLTGEYGYKVLAPRESALDLWVKAAQEATPAGLEVLELAMLEVRQPVLRHETADSAGASVLEMGANWLVDVSKDEFVGRDQVLAAFEAGSTVRTIGFSGTGPVPEPGTEVTVDGEAVGEVVYATRRIGADDTLGLARVRPELAAAGLRLTVADAEVSTLTSPYVTPRSWSTPII
ncbi:hypothetical protein [Isoptericola croceus]|uniref:hypothetical protein n=1 Tax=Isoptericola croceus TaxID=3031406 RepID=UPI0023F73EB7|nr:hypothetical protein [Isoptericola croceus]